MDEFKKILSNISRDTNKLLHLIDKRDKDGRSHLDSIQDEGLKNKLSELLKKVKAGQMSVDEVMNELNNLKNADKD